MFSRTRMLAISCSVLLFFTLFLLLQSWQGSARSGVSLEQLRTNRTLLEKILLENVIPFWYPRTLDRENGGFLLNHDREGKWLGASDKALVTQARCVWFFSRLAGSKFGQPEHLEAATHGFHFLKDRMWDKDHGGFHWAVDHVGTRAVKPQKHLYGQSFALYALSEYYRASGHEDALKLADGLFDLIEEKAYDSVYGGYGEFFLPDWETPDKEMLGYMGVGADVKLMNTHLHLMEALTTYAEVSGRQIARERLLELVTIQSNTVVRKDLGACTDRYNRQWEPLRGPQHDRVSFGHDLENIWLLQEANAEAGRSQGPFRDLYRTLFDYSLRYGFDSDKGGYFYHGPFRGMAESRMKSWWVQAECLVSALSLYQLTGETRYYENFTATLDWVNKYQVDWEHGDWHNMVDEKGEASQLKASDWKSPYHNGRALLEAIERIDELLSRGE